VKNGGDNEKKLEKEVGGQREKKEREKQPT